MGAGRIFFGVILVLVGLYLIANAFLVQIISFGLAQTNPFYGFFAESLIPDPTSTQMIKGFVGIVLIIIGIGIGASGRKPQPQF